MIHYVVYLKTLGPRVEIQKYIFNLQLVTVYNQRKLFIGFFSILGYYYRLVLDINPSRYISKVYFELLTLLIVQLILVYLPFFFARDI